MTDALEGITVLDLTRLLPGAVATQYLASHGAEVVKIEQPGTGDYARQMNPPLFARTNAGKKSVVLDLKDLQSRKLLLALATRADVLVEGFRPGVMARLGLAYETVQAANPNLIYVSLTGYGQHGPWSSLAGHDINYIAVGGLLALNLQIIPGVQIADLVGGSMQTVVEILMALHQRRATGCGRHIDVSMTAGVTSLLTIPLALYAETGQESQPGNELLSGRYACYNLYQARDGRWLAVGALEPKFWTELCGRLGCPGLASAQFDDARQEELKSTLGSIFRARDAADWFALLRAGDCCVTPVRTVSEVAAELPPLDLPPAPALGQHTHEILDSLRSSAT
jgi:crotonobetainyl-CoA:carnitine CoA-transferase CaiB-like acyl-CoA transferase